MERDDLILQREQLSRRLESNECLLKEKEDEVFLQLERVVYLEEQCDKVSKIQKSFLLTLKMHKLSLFLEMNLLEIILFLDCYVFNPTNKC